MSAAFEAGDHRRLPAIDRLILLRLGDWSDDFGYCWPGIDDLVAKVGVDGRTIQRHVAALQRAGLLERVVVGGGRHRSTLYRILPELLPDSDQAPGRLRYEQRFGLDQKGDTVTGFSKPASSSPVPEKVTGKAKKPRPSSVTRSVIIHQDPSSDISIPNLDPPRLAGESHKDYMFRIADSWGKE